MLSQISVALWGNFPFTPPPDIVLHDYFGLNGKVKSSLLVD